MRVDSGDEAPKKKKKKTEEVTQITPGGDILALYQNFKQQKSSNNGE